MNTNSLTIGGETITVRSMPIDNYVRFLKQIQTLQGLLGKMLKDYKMKTLMDLLEQKGDVAIGFLMDVIITAPDDLFKLMAIVLDVEVAVIKKATPEEFLDAVEVAKTVNDFKALWGKTKKVLGLTTSQGKKRKR